MFIFYLKIYIRMWLAKRNAVLGNTVQKKGNLVQEKGNKRDILIG